MRLLGQGPYRPNRPGGVYPLAYVQRPLYVGTSSVFPSSLYWQQLFAASREQTSRPGQSYYNRRPVYYGYFSAPGYAKQTPAMYRQQTILPSKLRAQQKTEPILVRKDQDSEVYLIPTNIPYY